MPKKSNGKPTATPSTELVKASYNAGLAQGRLEAIEESMDTLAALIFKAETMIASLGETPDSAVLEGARHTLRALQVAFAAVTEAANGTPAFLALLDQSRQRLLKKAASLH